MRLDRSYSRRSTKQRRAYNGRSFSAIYFVEPVSRDRVIVSTLSRVRMLNSMFESKRCVRSSHSLDFVGRMEWAIPVLK